MALPEAQVLQNHWAVKSISSRLQVPGPARSVFDWLFCLFANLPVSKPAGMLQSESAKCRAAVRDLSRSVCTSLLEKTVDCSLSYWHYEVSMVCGFVPCQGSLLPCHVQPHCSESGWEPMAKIAAHFHGRPCGPFQRCGNSGTWSVCWTLAKDKVRAFVFLGFLHKFSRENFSLCFGFLP